MDVLDALDLTRKRLVAAGIDATLLEAQMLVAHSAGQDKNWAMTHPDGLIDPLILEPFVRRRENREPLAYILGWREFYGRRFDVCSDVLIPRHETETLVELALALILNIKAPRIIDLGTGSGCLAVTIKLERPDALVAASDVSPAALKVAEDNATKLGASILFRESDLFKSWRGEKFDLIVSNPPYVGANVELPPEVRLFEPPLALFGYDGYDEYDLYRRIAREAKANMTSRGLIAIEVGDHQATDVIGLFEKERWCRVQMREDLDGMPRALAFQRV